MEAGETGRLLGDGAPERSLAPVHGVIAKYSVVSRRAKGHSLVWIVGGLKKALPWPESPWRRTLDVRDRGGAMP